MPGLNKIDKFQLGDRILALCGDGLTDEEISNTLNQEAEGNYTVSRPTVSRWLQGVRRARAQKTKKVYDEHIEVVLPQDLEALERLEKYFLGIALPNFNEDPNIEPATEPCQNCKGTGTIKSVQLNEPQAIWNPCTDCKGTGKAEIPPEVIDPRNRVAAADRVIKIIDTKLKYAGLLDDPGGQGDDDSPVDLAQFRKDIVGVREQEAGSSEHKTVTKH